MKKLVSLSLLLFACSTITLGAEKYKLITGSFDPGKTGTIVSRWIIHLGLMDPGEADHDNYGLLMSKNTLTPTNAAAVSLVVIASTGSSNLAISDLQVLGYDIRNGSHCGAGSPRFDVFTSDGQDHFVGGCAHGTTAPQGQPGWTTVRFDVTNPTQAYPPILPGEVVKNIFLLVDEGTDAGPDFSGEETLDNIYIQTSVNSFLIGEP